MESGQKERDKRKRKWSHGNVQRKERCERLEENVIALEN